ncbi:MAG: hypothetical protein R3B46_11765 [Phycisphaerales bacterium]
MGGGLGVVDVVGVDGVDVGEGDVSALLEVGRAIDAGDVVVDIGGVAEGREIAVEGPALDDGEDGEVGGVARVDDLLAAGLAHGAGRDLEEGREALEHGEGFAE